MSAITCAITFAFDGRPGAPSKTLPTCRRGALRALVAVEGLDAAARAVPNANVAVIWLLFLFRK